MTDHGTAERPLISMTLIVRNSSATLDRCLGSLAGHVDEIVVADTGSTDDTKAIARRYTDRVYDFAWVDDFAAARQFAMDRATGEWVGWQDSDEELLGGEHLRDAVRAIDPEITTVHWRTLLGRDAHGQVGLSYWRERLVRNDGSYRWSGAVHEVLIAADPDRRPTRIWRLPGVQTRHEHAVGGSGSRRNLDILERSVRERDERGEPVDSRTLYYLAQEYRDHGQADDALATLARYQDVATWSDERYMAEAMAARLHVSRGAYREAEAAWSRAILLKPRWPMAYFGLAATSYFQQRWADVVHWCDTGRALPSPDTSLFVSRREIGHDWLIHYTVAMSNLGRVVEALWWTQWALGNDPDDHWHRVNLPIFRASLVDAQRPMTPPAT